MWLVTRVVERWGKVDSSERLTHSSQFQSVLSLVIISDHLSQDNIESDNDSACFSWYLWSHSSHPWLILTLVLDQGMSPSHKFPVMNIKFKIVSCRQQLILSKYWIRLVKDLNITCLLLQNALSPRGISGWRNYFNFNLSTNLNIFLRLLKNCFVSVLTKRSPLLPMLENCPIYIGTQPIRCKSNIWSTLETRSWR